MSERQSVRHELSKHLCYPVDTMTAATPDFENQPATKRDLAEVKNEFHADVEVLRNEVKEGFENLERLLSAPSTGLIPRVKRPEETVGIRPGE